MNGGFGRSGIVLFVVAVSLAAVLTTPATPGSLPSPTSAGSLRTMAASIVFLGETPANGSLLGLLNPVTVIAVGYADLLPNATVVAVDFHLDGMNLTSAGAFNNTAFALPVGFALRDGPHFANFLLMDNYGMVGYHNWTFTVDTIPPILIVTSPAYPAVPVPAVPVQGTALPAMAAAAPVTVAATALPSHATVATLADPGTGAFSLTMPLTEGPNILFVNATDAAGNLASEVKAVLRDTVKPPLVVLTPVNGSVSPTSIVRVSGLSEFGAYLAVNGYVAVVAPNGTWSVSLALPDGLNIIQVAAADAVGNVNVAGLGVFVDSDAPRIALTGPLPSVTNRSSIDLSGSVNDSFVAALFVRYGLSFRPLSFDAITGHFATTLAGLPDGTYTIEVTAVDAAQRAATVTSVVVVDTTPPVVRISQPPAGLETAQGTVRIVGTVDDPTATVLVNDAVLRPDATGHWQTVVAVIEGGNTIRIGAVDVAGNRAVPILLHLSYFSPYPGLANRTSANENNLEALAGFARLSLAGIVVLAVGVELLLYARMDRKVRESRRLLAEAVRAVRTRPKPPTR